MLLPIALIAPRVNSAGRSQLQPGVRTLANAAIPDCDLHLVDKGSGCVAVDETRYALEEGDVLTVFPGESFYAEADEDTVFSRYYIHFDFFKGDAPPPAGNGAPWPRLVRMNDEVEARSLCADIVLQFHRIKDPAAQTIADGKLHTLLGIVLSQHLVSQPQAGAGPLKSRRNILKAVSFISENYPEDLSLEELAESAGLSVNYFGQMFRLVTGMSPRQFLIDCRLRQAKRLLLQTDHNISEVAALVGYEDISHFSSTFKKREGVTPTEFISRLSIDG